MTISMSQVPDDSTAFRQALLLSEKRRIAAVISFVGFFTLLIFLRIFIFGSAMSRWAFLATIIVVTIEALALRSVNKALQASGDISPTVWYCTITAETLFPAVGVAFMTSSRLPPDYLPLATPWALVFQPFIFLSVLRLNSRLCIFSGVISTVAYVTAAYYTGWRPASTLTGFSVTQTAVLTYSVIFILSGFLGGAVAAEIRKHVEAALREADTRHQLMQVEHDLQIARSIQQSLLPTSTPEIEGFEIAGWNQPADHTGGDYYDWQVLPDGKLLVALGDVTGHGIGPALLAALCRAYARANFTSEHGLVAAMERVNCALSRDFGEGRFVTFVAATCSPISSQVELLSAGHGPLFVYWLREDRFDAMAAQGLPLGLMPDLTSEPPKILNFQSGDLLVLTTDGFFEWANAKNEQFGAKRLEDAIRASREKSPAEIIAGLYKAVVEFSEGTEQADDLTAVVIKRK
jgi:serine phosphatase RsbU (regulator of sigma subunit)